MDDQKNVKLHDQIGFEIIPYQLEFKKPAKTSRDTLHNRNIFFIKAFWKNTPEIFGVGECSPIAGLSPEDPSKVEKEIQQTAKQIASSSCFNPSAIAWPAIRFAFEVAIMDLCNGGDRIIVNNFDTSKIPINGLVWMNEFEEMKKEVVEKIDAGFDVIKLKIGGIHFNDELQLLQEIRNSHSKENITIRLDANGSFSPVDALEKLELLASFDIHSIEQPLKPGLLSWSKEIIQKSPIPIALDEELIGVETRDDKWKLLEMLQPQFIVLKPSLHGGLSGCDEWIDVADQLHIRWWATSMLESSVGLNAIAQWVSVKKRHTHQGLGTGSLYKNNVPAAWSIENGYLKFDELEPLKKHAWNG